MTLRAYDLSGRTARRGRDSVMRRVERWRSYWFLIAQTAVTAGTGVAGGHRAAEPRAAVLRAGGGDHHPRRQLRPADAARDRDRDRRGGRRAGRRAVRDGLRQRGLADHRGARAGDVGGHLAVDPPAGDHPGLRAVGDRRHAGPDRLGGRRPLAGRGGRLRPGPGGGDRRAERPTAQAGAAGCSGAERSGRDPGRRSDRAQGVGRAGRRRGAGAGPGHRGRAGRAQRGDRRRPGGGPPVAVPPPPACRDRGVRPAVRAAGPCEPQPPRAGPPMRRRAVAGRGGAGAVPRRR